MQGPRQSFTEGESMRLTADALTNLKQSMAAEDLSSEQVRALPFHAWSLLALCI